MKTMRLQRGAGMYEIMMYLFVAGFIATFAMKTVPYYLDDRIVASAMLQVHKDLVGKDIQEVTNSDIKARFSRYFQVDGVSDQVMESLDITREGGSVIVTMNYEVRNPFMGNLDLVLKFKHEADFSKPPVE